MKSNELIGRFIEVLDDLDKEGVKVPGLIMSSPGFGKTTTVEMWCRVKDYNLTTLIASQYSQDDILGIQAVNNGRLERLAPAWYNQMVDLSSNGKRNVLFIDELTTCDEFLQAPLLNLIFGRSLGLHTLPENTLIVTAGNYSEELNGVFSLTAPLVNRFLILNLKLSDFDIREVTNNKIRTLDTKDKVEEYLGLQNSGESVYDPTSFPLFIERYIPFGKSEIINNSEKGLIGFTSVRSVFNCIDFYKMWISKFESSDWTRIVGDTLGTLVRGDKVVLAREFLLKNIKLFVKKQKVDKAKEFIGDDFNALLQELVSTPLNSESLCQKASNYIDSQGLSEAEAELLKRLSSLDFNSYITHLYDKYKEGVKDVID